MRLKSSLYAGAKWGEGGWSASAARVLMFNGQIEEVQHMNTMKNLVVRMAMIAVVLGMTACAGMSAQDKNTAIGAGVGAVGGSVLSGGSAVGTVGGAVVGGVIGNQVTPKK